MCFSNHRVRISKYSLENPIPVINKGGSIVHSKYRAWCYQGLKLGGLTQWILVPFSGPLQAVRQSGLHPPHNWIITRFLYPLYLSSSLLYFLFTFDVKRQAQEIFVISFFVVPFSSFLRSLSQKGGSMDLFSTNCRKHCLRDVIMKKENSVVVVI